MLVLLCLSFLTALHWSFAQAQVSGNAIDLANMNMNMMNMKCPLEPCQSVCLKKHQETGCFICDPTCNSGSSIVIPEGGLPMPMQPINAGQSGYYAGCDQDNWMRCPMSCQRKFDQNGCFQCLCQSIGVVKTTTRKEPTPTPTESLTSVKTTRLQTTNGNVPTTQSLLASSTNTKRIETKWPTTTTTQQLGTQEKGTTTESVSIATQIVYTSPLSKISLDDFRQTQTLKSSKQTQTFSYHKNEEGIETTLPTENVNAILYQSSKPSESNFQPNNLTFVLFGIMTVLLTLSLALFIAWRKSSRKLKKNKDELYFVHKAYRQDSTARLPSNEMTDPVYTDIGPRPEPPPRSHRSTRSNGTSDDPIRSLSQSSETPLKEHYEEFKHDYLELI